MADLIDPVGEDAARRNQMALREALKSRSAESRKQGRGVVARSLVEQDIAQPDATDAVKGENMGLKGDAVAEQVMAIRQSPEYAEQLKIHTEDMRKSAEAVGMDVLAGLIPEIRLDLQKSSVDLDQKLKALNAIATATAKVAARNSFTINIDNRKIDLQINAKDWRLDEEGQMMHIPSVRRTEARLQASEEGTMNWLCAEKGCQLAQSGSALRKAVIGGGDKKDDDGEI